MPNRPAIVFAGTPDFAVPTLRALTEVGFPVTAVYTQPDRPAGRGRKVRPSPVKMFAEIAGIPVYQPATLKQSQSVETLRKLGADLMVVVAYGLILPQVILDLPRFGCWNVHASLLPRWRGAAPIQRALLAGDSKTGVTIMQMAAGLDTGDMIARREVPINGRSTTVSLHNTLAEVGSELLIETLNQLADGQLPAAEPQQEADVTYAHKLTKAEGALQWARSAVELDRSVRALNPWPGTRAEVAGEEVKIIESEVLDLSASQQPGQIVAAGTQGIDIATGSGQLRILRLQRPGKRPVGAADFANSL